jgi:lysophospholipase L1-like esterase
MSRSPLTQRGWAKSKTLPTTATRRSLRVISAVVVAVVLAAIGAGVASAHPVNGSDRNGTYLALGDSVAFGYVPPQAVPAPNYFDARSFVGYPEFLGQQLNERVSNASCPGETSASLLFAGVQSNGCENSLGSPVGYSTLYPLHVEYQGTQMDYALHYLAVHKHTRLITIDIGANDAFLCQETTADGCLAEIPGVLTDIATNLGTIFADLRGTGYQGPIVVLTYYSLSYTDPLDLLLTGYLDAAIAGVTTAYGGIVADGFTAFEGPSLAAGGTPCAAGLLIPVPSQFASAPGISPTGTGCNIHPTPAGQQLLSGAIEAALSGT